MSWMPVWRRLRSGALCVLCALAGLAAAQPAPVPPDRSPALPRLVSPQRAERPVQIERLSVQVQVLGTLAQTELELVLRNPNSLPLEGTLEFPLREGQSVSGFALDIGGEMRPAVPVEKVRGRQVFEEIQRRNVDPALLEQAAGNVYKLRVFPLPAQGTRRVKLQLSQPLAADADGRIQWLLPLDFGQPIPELNLDIALPGVPAEGLVASGLLQRLPVLPGQDGPRLRAQLRDTRAEQPLALSWPAQPVALSRVERFQERSYFYAELPQPAEAGEPQFHLRGMTVIWDASGSGAQRDHARELALLQALVGTTRSLRVTLIVARHEAEPPRDFQVNAGDWSALRKHLEGLAYDGASNPAAWRSPPVGKAIGRPGLTLLFSDGLANWGSPALPDSPAPLNTINASAASHGAVLRQLAQRSGGRSFDLLAQSPQAVARALLANEVRVVDVRGEGVDQLELAARQPESGRLVLAGRLTAPRGRVVLTLQHPDGRRSERVLELGDADAADDGRDAATGWPPLAAQRWAELRLARLEAEPELHRAEIRRVGQQFYRVSSGTSLIVLESLADYLRYEITPPPSLREEYRKQQQLGADRLRTQSDRRLQALASRWADRVAWWKKDFPKTPESEQDKAKAAYLRAQEAPSSRRVAAPDLYRPAAPATSAMPAPAPAAPPPPAVAYAPAAPAPAAPAPTGASSGQESRGAGIQLRKFQPNEPYAARLRDATPQQRYAVYLDERPGYLNSSAFFLDAADIFEERGQPELALRVLSNLAEMAVENRALLRVLAYRLQQAGEHALALPVLERVRELAPDEPQSWRDLALAHARLGQAQKAVDLLWEGLSRPQVRSFGDVDLIMLAELNALAARHPGLDLQKVEPALRGALPVSLRAVLGWDADNTDIDLWVIDPDGEATYFSRPLSRQGGRISRDVTQGYGPEEFVLRDAKPGRYEVRAKFYGHRQQVLTPYTTLMLWLSSDFGLPGQKDQHTVLRLTDRGDQVLVGTFTVPEPRKAKRPATPAPATAR